MRSLLVLFLVFGLQTSWGQSPLIDSLLSQLIQEKDQKTRIDIYNELSWEYSEAGKWEKSREFAHKAEQFSLKVNYTFGLAKHYNYEGVAFMNRSSYDTAQNYFLKSISLLKRLKDHKALASAYSNLGLVYFYQSQYDKALEIHQNCLATRKKLKDVYGTGVSYVNIANVFDVKGNFKKSLEYNLLAKQCFKKINDSISMAEALGKIGLAYSKQSHHKKGAEYFHLSIHIRKQNGDTNGLSRDLASLGAIKKNENLYPEAIALLNKSSDLKVKLGDLFGSGSNYFDKGDSFLQLAHSISPTETKKNASLLDSAEKWLIESWKISLKTNDAYLKSFCLNGLAKAASTRKNDRKALLYLKESEKVSASIETPENMSRTLRQISDISVRSGNYRDAYEYYLKHELIEDSLFNKSKSMVLGKMEASFAYEKNNQKNCNLEKMLLAICQEPLQTQKHKLDLAFEKWKGPYEQTDDVCLIGVKFD